MGIVTRPADILSRRNFARMLGCAVALCPACADPHDLLGLLAANPAPSAGLDVERRYRADAHVLLFGVPVLHRQAVGEGRVVWRESAASGTARFLEFSAFSVPARAAGVNRMGFIREIARTGQSGGECIYFGLMTASPEESAAAAREALHTTAKEQAFTAIDGRIGAGQTETAIAHFTAPASLSGGCTTEVLELARHALASARTVAVAETGHEYASSFLQCLAGLLMRPERAEGSYIYSGRRYRLQLSRSRDAKASAYFSDCGLIRGQEAVIRVSGQARREAGDLAAEFRLWVVNGAKRPLPLRIDYRAKSYLRLVFEVVA